MSRRRRRRAAAGQRTHASVFAALGDETRLSLVAKLRDGRAHSIMELKAGSRLTRQAITKHLRVMERAEIVRSMRAGRVTRFEIEPEPIEELKKYLDLVSAHWDKALSRLKLFVED